jgi:ubiquinone/menaquinone biosynthesis C-methylase UbiE
LDVGGAGYYLEAFGAKLIRQCFAQITLVEGNLSKAAELRKKVEKMDLSDVVKIVETDFLKLNSTAKSFEVITFSYSLSNSSNVKAALKMAEKLLKKNGHLLIADFYDAKPGQNALSHYYDFGCKKYFEMLQKVNLLSFDFINRHSGAVTQSYTTCSRSSNPLMLFVRPWHGLWMGIKK